MAWTAPKTDFVSGNVLTAAQMNAIGENLVAGGPIYTTEAARDAAITSPFEGQQAYITASEAAKTTATGTTPAIPTGVSTTYNGSVWVCTTEVGAVSYTSATTTSGTYVSTLTGDATAISATLVTGTTALVTAWLRGSVNAAATVAIAVSLTGATTITAAASNFASSFASGTGGYQFAIPLTLIATGLTAGTNTFTLNYATANTLTVLARSLTVKGIA
jgi:hypothetical protein